ncbi:MAG: ACP S-malonyltransferase [Deltaproteobacteria bacterium]|nr:ACP S-malonyltransferase [Deltaproteobacteria bacterium]
MTQIAFLFPGQGSQYVGMGKDFYEAHPKARELFDLAEEVTNLPLKRLCFEGPMEKLTETVNLQPAITVVNLCVFEALVAAGLKPQAVCGHSLGEYSALYAAGVLSARDTLAAVRERGRLMQREAEKHKGAMAAVIGLAPDKLADLLGFLIESGSFALANFNTPEQTVVSGTPELVAKAGELAKAAGARAVPLKVSGAWHSPLMAGATQDFADFLAARTFQTPTTAIYLNATALPADTADGIREAMSRQLTSPVRFCDLILNMKASGVDTWVEVGPKNVLKGLVRKILPQEPAERFHNVQDQPTLAAFLEALKA